MGRRGRRPLRKEFLLHKLPDQQQDDAGDAEKADDQSGDEVDLEDDAGDAGGQIQQPQADEAGDRVDGDLPDELYLGEQELEHQHGDQHGDDEGENIFHGFPPRIVVLHSIA